MTLFTFLAIALLMPQVTLILPQSSGPQAVRADVSILLTDGWGNEITKAEVRFQPKGGWGSSYWIQYPQERRASLTPGAYLILVDAEGFRRYGDTVDLPRGRTLLTLSLALGEITTPQPDLMPVFKGHLVKELLTESPVWVRLVGIYTGITKVAEVDETGRFEIAEMMPGRYMLFVFNGGKLRYSQSVDVRRYKEPEVTIGPAHETVPGQK